MSQTSIFYKPGTKAKLPTYATVAERPDASVFGVGVCQVGKRLYISDGSVWSPSTTKDLFRNRSQQKPTKKPLIRAPLWAALTAYVVGNRVRHSNGQLLVCVASGTSLAGEPTFSSTALMAESGGPSWVWFGEESKVNTDGYDVPTITCNTTIPTSAVLNALYSTAVTGPIYVGTLTNGGTGYGPGTYYNVPLTGGTGTGATAWTIVVNGSGVITSVTTNPEGTGTGYTVNDSLSANPSYLGGTGSGFVFTASHMYQDKSNFPWALQPDCIKTRMVSSLYSNALIYNRGGSGQPVDSGARIIEFMTDDPFPGISFHNSNGKIIPVYVDGYPIEENITALVTGNPSYYKIDWGGIRRLRRYTIYAECATNIKGVAILASSVLYAPEDDNLYAVVLGDSNTATISTYNDGKTFDFLGQQIGRALGFKATVLFGIGSTGYYVGKTANDNNVSATNYNALAVLQNNPRTDIAEKVGLVVFMHGTNDTSTAVATVTANALAAWQLARQQYPNAVIEIIGPINGAGGPSSTAITLDNALYAQFQAWGDDLAFYHRFCTDPRGAWVSGTGKWGTTTGTGNADFYVGADAAHPSYPGRAYLVNRIVNKINLDLVNLGL